MALPREERVMRRFLIHAAIAGVTSFAIGAGLVLLAAKAATGSWCPRCEVIEMTEDLRDMNRRVEAINRRLAGEGEKPVLLQPSEPIR